MRVKLSRTERFWHLNADGTMDTTEWADVPAGTVCDSAILEQGKSLVRYKTPDGKVLHKLLDPSWFAKVTVKGVWVRNLEPMRELNADDKTVSE